MRWILFGLLLLAGCSQVITNFDECVKAGNPVMESYPAQCKANGEVFTQKVETVVDSSRAERIAIEYLSKTPEFEIYNGRNIRINRALKVECDGCWQIELEYDIDSIDDPDITDQVVVRVTLSGWIVTDMLIAQGKSNEISIGDCDAQGGHLVQISNANCNENEQNIGRVKESSNPSICCKPNLEAFCGTSIMDSCKTSSDCITSGCSAQICQSKTAESLATTCEWRECYNAGNYQLSCGCVEGKCQWA